MEKAISLHISHLLIHHDCVVLPSFGALLANNKPAGVDIRRDYFIPPRRELSFNRNIQDNDGLLASRIARSEQISYAEANQRLRQFILEIEYMLAEGRTVELPEIGTFTRDLGRNILFSPRQNNQILPEAYGLQAFHFSKFRKKTYQPEINPRLKKNLKKSLIYAPAALLLGLIPFKWEQGSEFLASSMNLFPAFNTEHSATLKPAGYEESNTHNIYITPEHFFLEETFLQLKVSKENLLNANAREYFIIAASYPGPNGAEKFRKRLVDLGYTDAKVLLGENGRYRVCYAGFATMKEAENELIRFKKQINPDAWIHRQTLSE